MSQVYTDLKAFMELDPSTTGYTMQSIWNDATAQKDQSYIIAQQNPGSPSTENVRKLNFTVTFISKVNDTAIQDLWDNAEDLHKYLLFNWKNLTTIIAINSLADVQSPRPLTDGRWYASFEIAILYSVSE